MKKLLVAGGVLAAVVLLAPNAMGRFAESRSDKALDSLLENVPYLSIVERDWDRGWFTSKQQITFESRLPLAGEVPTRFTVHNDVLHGPVLGLSGLGAARVKSHIDLPAETRAKIRETFGEQPALEMTTRLGFTGGGRSTLRSRGRTIREADGSEVRYETATMEVGFSRDLARYEIEASLPQVEARGVTGEKVRFDRLTLDGDAKRMDGFRYLYDSDFKLRIRELSTEDSPQGNVRVKNLHYGGGMELDDGLLSIKLSMGSDAVESDALASSGLSVREIYYDMAVNRLHARTMDEVYGGMQQFYRDLSAAGAEGTDPFTDDEVAAGALFTPLAENAGALLAHDPELQIDRIGFSTGQGKAVLKGVVRIVGLTEQDFAAAGLLGALGKLDADLNLDIDEAVLSVVPNGDFLAEAGVASGYLRRNDGKLTARILFRNGSLIVNGQTQSVPLPGAQPRFD